MTWPNSLWLRKRKVFCCLSPSFRSWPYSFASSVCANTGTFMLCSNSLIWQKTAATTRTDSVQGKIQQVGQPAQGKKQHRASRRMEEEGWVWRGEQFLLLSGCETLLRLSLLGSCAPRPDLNNSV